MKTNEMLDVAFRCTSPCLSDPVVDNIDSKNTPCDWVESGGDCDFRCLEGFVPEGTATCDDGIWDTSQVGACKVKSPRELSVSNASSSARRATAHDVFVGPHCS